MLLPGETIQSQYAASPIIRALAESARIRIAPDADIALFYRCIFDIATAEGVGLDIWGHILGIGRSVEVQAQRDYFGFNTADYDPFDVSPFYTGEGATERYDLEDDAYRQLLLWKAMANIATADAASLNHLMAALYPGQDIVVHEWGVMALELYIFFPLLPWQRALLRNYGLLAKGAGVGLNWSRFRPRSLALPKPTMNPSTRPPSGPHTPRRPDHAASHSHAHPHALCAKRRAPGHPRDQHHARLG